MANARPFHKLKTIRLMAVLSQYTKLGSMFLYHFCTFMKTCIQLLFTDYDDILPMDRDIHANTRRGSVDTEDFSRNAIEVIKASYILLGYHGRDVID